MLKLKKTKKFTMLRVLLIFSSISDILWTTVVMNIIQEGAALKSVLKSGLKSG
jgi:hypothetical protein